MTASKQQDELLDLFDALCAGTLDNDQAASVEKSLADDPAARQLYVSYMHLRVNSQYLADVQRPAFEAADLIDALVEEEVGSAGPALGVLLPDAVTGTSPTPPFSFPIASSSIHYPLSTIHSAILSYSIAALILSAGLAIAWAWKVPNYPELVRNTSPAAAHRQRLPEVRPNLIGRITGMVNCRFLEGSKTEDQRPKTTVSIGDKFVIRSGLMEISYDTGAQVILHGPVTYEVESSASGYLSVGKLTARLDGNAKRGTPNAKLPGSSSAFSVQPSAFVVRTPTATVTDLGTEFGMTVSEGGVTQIHVLQGVVDAQPIAARGGTATHRRITAGAAVEIGRQSYSITTVAFAPASFTRKLKQVTNTPAESAYVNAVLADKPLGYWPLNEPTGARKILDRSGNGLNGYVMRKLSLGRPGPLGGDSRAIEFNGDGYIDLGRCDQFAMKNDFTVEAWAWIGDVQWSSHIVSVLGGEAQEHIGWGLIVGRAKPGPKSDKNPTLLDFIVYGQKVDNFYFSVPVGEPIERRWMHVAVVFDRANLSHLYLDGQHRGSVAVNEPARVGAVWLQIGCAQVIDEDLYRGRLAHVAVYPRALSDKQIRNHFSQRNSGKEVTGKQ
jgi:hypothetical protein